MSAKRNSPCIGICKFERDGHCIGCSMTKPQKKIAKKLDCKDEQDAFLAAIMAQQNRMGGYEIWHDAYAKKYKKAG